jgi:hypothetical protein
MRVQTRILFATHTSLYWVHILVRGPSRGAQSEDNCASYSLTARQDAHQTQRWVGDELI